MRLIAGPFNRFQGRGPLPSIAIHDGRALRNFTHLQPFHLSQGHADALLARRRVHSFDGYDHSYILRCPKIPETGGRRINVASQNAKSKLRGTGFHRARHMILSMVAYAVRISITSKCKHDT